MKTMLTIQSRRQATAKFFGLCLSLLCICLGSTAAAQSGITVRGLPSEAEGDVFAEILVDQPAESVRMTIPGVLDRIERFAPYGLASDSGGRLNPFDTTAHNDGDYVLTVTATLRNGNTLTRTFPFAIRNQPAPVATPSVQVLVAGLPSTVRGTVFPEIRVNQPVDSVRMAVDGIVDRTERQAPFGLMSDSNGRVNPFDSTRYPDGDYDLNITIALSNGRRASANYSFSIDNKPDAVSEPVVLDIPTGVFDDAATPEPSAPGISAPEPVAPEPTTPEPTTPETPAQPEETPAAPQPEPVDPIGSPETETPEPVAPETPAAPETPDSTPVSGAPEVPEIPEPVVAPLEVKVVGIPRGTSASGDLRVEAVVDQPVESVSFSIPGVVQRTERLAPFALASDSGGRINPWNTREVPNGPYTLTVVATAEDGRTATSRVSFVIDNAPAPVSNPSGPEAGSPEPQTPSPEPEPPAAETPAPEAPAPEPTPPATQPEPTPAPAPSASGPSIRPSGNNPAWRNPPNRVGNSGAPGADRIALARWDAVSERDFRGQFPLGVVAHHLYGIDYVEFQVDGGTPVRVNAPSVNPRTRVDGYWVVLDANDFGDRRIEVRATAYPHNGIPRKLEPLFLFANQGGTLKFPVLELPAGRHTLNARNLPTQGWLTVRPAPGVSRDKCIIVGRSRGWRAGNLKLENLTYEPGSGNGPLTGFSHDNRLWMDRVRVVGAGEANPTNWITQAWTHQYYTDCEFTRVRRVFHHGPVTARNIEAYEIYEDFANANGLFANIKVDRLDRRSITSAHPDLFQYGRNIPGNLIIQDLTSTNNNGQGLFTDDMRDVAVVRLNVTTVSPFRAIQLQGRSENILIQDSNFNGSGNFRLDQGFSADDLVFRDSRSSGPPLFLPANWNTPGVRVLPPPPIFD
ncbi:MAG: hypothetical protein AAGH99_11270 [Planctomycetota bacterium]